MDITLHEEFYGRKTTSHHAVDSATVNSITPKKQTIVNIMAFSKALTVQTYSSLGPQEIILN